MDWYLAGVGSAMFVVWAFINMLVLDCRVKSLEEKVSDLDQRTHGGR